MSRMMVSVASGLLVSWVARLRWLLTQGKRGVGDHFFIRGRGFDESTYVRPGQPRDG